MTKEDAEKELDFLLRKQLNTFCPLIKDTCHLNCVCFYPGKLNEYDLYNGDLSEGTATKGYDLFKPECQNKMFFGEQV